MSKNIWIGVTFGTTMTTSNGATTQNSGRYEADNANCRVDRSHRSFLIGSTLRQVVFFSAMAAALISSQAMAQAVDSYSPVPVKIVNPIEPPLPLEKLLAGLRTAADDQNLVVVLSQVGNSFFWDGDHGGGFNASASPRDNFTTALSLDPKQIKQEYRAELWLTFKTLLGANTASTYPGKPGVICLPGKGKPVNEATASKTAEKFGTDLGYGMMFAVGLPVAVRQMPKSSATIVGAIDNEAVFVRHKLRTDPDATWEPVRLASGSKGWVKKTEVRTFLDSQLCFAKGNDKSWKIVGYNAGGD